MMTIRKVLRALVEPVGGAQRPASAPGRDPWLSDAARRQRVNEASSRNARRWIPRRPGWLSKLIRAIASLVRPMRPARPIRHELGLEPGGMYVRDLTEEEWREADARLLERHRARPRWLDRPGR